MKMNMKTKNELEERYKRIWLETKLNASFIFAVNLLREKWKIKCPSTLVSDFASSEANYQGFITSLRQQNDKYLQSEIHQFIPAITEVLVLEISDYHKSNIILLILSKAPESRFLSDMETFTTIFDFGKEWKYSLSFYIVTDQITVPYHEPKQERISNKIQLMTNIFYLDVLKRMKKPKHKNITDLNIGQRLVENISDSATDEELINFDRKLQNKIKKNRERFRQTGYFIPLTKARQSNLKQLFS